MPTCGHCRDCKWWERFSAPIWDAEQHRQTLQPIAQGHCARWDHPGALVYVEVAQGEDATISTDADFGCVQFEPKETAKEPS